MGKYVKTLILAIFLVVIIWLGSCYYFFVGGKFVDEEMPQHLVRRMEGYITSYQGKFCVELKGRRKLDAYHIWMQIIDEQGDVCYAYGTNENIPMHYSAFDLLYYNMQSNHLPGYTIYVNKLIFHPKYSVILGCDSSQYFKYSCSLSGNAILTKSVVLLLCIIFFVVVLLSLVYSRMVSVPVERVLDDIDRIAKGRELGPVQKENLLYDVLLQLKDLEQSLKANEKMRAEWISNISHDIKTPLSTIRGYAELLSMEDYEFEGEEVCSYAQEMLRSEKHIEELLEDLKISQMLVEGKMRLYKEKVNLVLLLEECIASVDTLRRGNSEILFLHDAQIEIECDRKLMQRSLQNILHNAFVHNPNRALQVIVEARQKEEGVWISISDNGRGMKEEDRKCIFERYYRGTGAQQTKGTGLGLSIARDVVQAHYGSIAVSSEVEKGTRFQIVL